MRDPAPKNPVQNRSSSKILATQTLKREDVTKSFPKTSKNDLQKLHFPL
tara:strand:- start:820 stop:966 length:147 start_codon:yes stop_codon:yes gene_type:complete